MTAIDLTVIGVYFSFVFLIGLWVQKGLKNSDDLFLAGRSLTWPVIGFSLFASNISSSTMIGLAGAAYDTGIAIANYEWMAALVLIFMCFFCIPVFIKTKITTLPELLEIRFDARARRYYSFITILLSIMVDTAGGLYAGALALKIFFPQFEIWQMCIALALFAGGYTVMGGLKAVVYTDFIQAVTLVVGSVLLTFLVFQEIDFSWSKVVASVPSSQLSLIRPLDDPNMPWLGTLLGLPLLGFWYWSTNQYITQRLLGAKDIENARWGAVLGAALKLIPLFTMVLPGAMALQLFPGLENPDMVYPTLIKELLPVGIVGLVVAGLIAAIMSSVDSTLNSASTLVLHDFIKPRYESFTEKQGLLYGRLTTLVLMLIAVVWAPMVGLFGGLFLYLQQAFAVLVPPVVVIFLMALFSQRGDSRRGFETLVFGHILGVALFVAQKLGWLQIHFTMGVPIVFVLSWIFYLWRSRADGKLAQSPAHFSWSELSPSRPVALWQDYRLWSACVVFILSIIVIRFW